MKHGAGDSLGNASKLTPTMAMSQGAGAGVVASLLSNSGQSEEPGQ